LEEIKSNDGCTVAIVVKKNFNKNGINFLSKNDFPLQLGINSYKKGEIIKSHIHQERSIQIINFQEVVYIKKGKASVKLYDSKRTFLKSIVLSTGDLIFLASGGHGFEILEDTVIIEVKQGPYLGKDQDKLIIDD
jgi:hypothetical protein